MIISSTINDRSASRFDRTAFTLIELLIVLSIFLVLTAIALPLTKKLLQDQKVTKASQSIEAFIEVARNRAIAEGRTTGVRFERLSGIGAERSASIHIRQLVGTPPYGGDASDATARLTASVPLGNIDRAVFDAADNPLVLLSATLKAAGSIELAPIRPGDLLELPGGRMVPINDIGPPGTSVTISFNLRELDQSTATFPGSGRQPIDLTNGDRVKYRIMRSPVPSRSKVFSLPRGIAVDLNYSGFGLTGNQFAPDTAAGSLIREVDILFDANGMVSDVVIDGVRDSPIGLIFFCIGLLDGVASIESGLAEDAFDDSNNFTANIMRLDSLWLVINPFTGQVTSVPFATISSEVKALRGQATPPDFKDPTLAAFDDTFKKSRTFATFSDSVNQ